MKNENFNTQLLTEYLQGTCKSLDEGLDNLYPGMTQDDLTPEDFDEIDNEIFLCDNCGWWCEISEQDDNGFCLDCAE